MAGLGITFTNPTFTTGVAAKTPLQVRAATHQRVKVMGISVSFQGVTPTQQPILVQLVYQSADPTGSAATAVKNNKSHTETVQTTGITGTTDATGTEVVWSDYVRADGGGITILREQTPLAELPGAQRLGVRVTADTNTTGSVSLVLEE